MDVSRNSSSGYAQYRLSSHPQELQRILPEELYKSRNLFPMWCLSPHTYHYGTLTNSEPFGSRWQRPRGNNAGRSKLLYLCRRLDFVPDATVTDLHLSSKENFSHAYEERTSSLPFWQHLSEHVACRLWHCPCLSINSTRSLHIRTHVPSFNRFLKLSTTICRFCLQYLASTGCSRPFAAQSSGLPHKKRCALQTLSAIAACSDAAHERLQYVHWNSNQGGMLRSHAPHVN